MSKGTLWDANTWKLCKALKSRLLDHKSTCRASELLIEEIEGYLKKLEKHMAKKERGYFR